MNENEYLLKWICNNVKKWEFICGVHLEKPSEVEIKLLFDEILNLASDNNEFKAISAVMLTRRLHKLL